MTTRFGPSGGGDEFDEEKLSIFELPEWLSKRGLDAFEYSFGHGYQMKTETAQKVGELFKQHDILLSLHAPYYINFANPDDIMYQKSENYLRTGIKFMRAFGYCDHFVFHSGSCGTAPRADAVKLIQDRFKQTFDKFEEENLMSDLFLCPETMGKPLQIGTYKEIVDLCKINSHLVPTFDFGHINALTHGSLKTKDDYKRIFDYCVETIGFERTSNCHIHFSKIQYGDKGEIKHLNFEDDVYGPNFEPMLETIVEMKLNPRIICESKGMQPRDAKTMKNFYDKLLDKTI